MLSLSTINDNKRKKERWKSNKIHVGVNKREIKKERKKSDTQQNEDYDLYFDARGDNE